MSARPPEEQRLAFGSVAALYERARPSYPQAAMDEVLAYAARRAALLERVRDVIERGGGTLEVHYRTTVCLARLAHPPGEVPA